MTNLIFTENYITMATKQKEDEKARKVKTSKEPKKLSKIGEFLRSGESLIEIIDMKAVLK